MLSLLTRYDSNEEKLTLELKIPLLPSMEVDSMTGVSFLFIVESNVVFVVEDVSNSSGGVLIDECNDWFEGNNDDDDPIMDELGKM